MIVATRSAPFALLIAAGAFAPACSKKADQPPPAAAAPAQPAAQPDAPAAPAEPPAPPDLELKTVQPKPLPADWPSYAKGSEIPADQYTVNATVGDKPANVTLKRDMVVGGIPCSAGEAVMFYEGEVLAECALAQDFTVEGIALQQGTTVHFQPGGAFVGITLPEPQLVKDVPLVARTRFYLTPPPRFDLASAVLARRATVQGMEFPAGTALDFDANDESHPLTSAKPAARATIGGTEYPGGVRLYFDADGKVTMARGVPRPPAGPLACPERSAATVESTNGGYPQGLAWTAIRGVRVQLGERGKPLPENGGAWLVLANFALPADFDVWDATLAEGQALIKLELGRDGGRGIAVGTYEVGPHGDNDFRVSPGIVVAGGTTLQFDSWHTEGTLEVVEVTAERICGRFALHDKWSRIQGEFVVPVTP